MKIKSNLYFLAAAVALLSWPAAGCGDSTECGAGTVKRGERCVAEQSTDETLLECGVGTVEENGACVPEGEAALCGPKTTLQDGQCVISADACASGETLDPNSGDCIAGGSECGPGTALDADSGACVPTEDVCDTGTVFDDTSGLCLPDACQVGDVLLGGVCVSPAQELAAQADLVETENNDPAQGGQSNELVLKDVGERAVFSGTIDAPADLSGNGEVDQDLDVFHFEAQAGQWLQISLQSTGIPSPAFLVEGPNGYQRFSPQLGGASTARQLLIPADGTYTVTVAPAAYMAAILAGDAAGGPYGESDWGYVGSVEKIDAPAPADIDLSGGALAGNYAGLTDNFFRFSGLSAGAGVSLEVQTSQADATGILQIWEDGEYVGSRPLAEGDTISLLSTGAGSLELLVDWQSLGGLASAFEISAAAQAGADGLGPVGSDDSVSTNPIDLEYNESVYYTFSAEAGQVIVLSASNDISYAPAQFKLTDSSGTTILPRADQPYDYVSLPPNQYAYSYTKTGGIFQLEVTPGNGFDLTNLVTHIATVTPTDLGEVAPGDNVAHSSSAGLASWASDFYTLSTAEAVVLSGQITGDSGAQISAKFLAESNQLMSDIGSQNTNLAVQDTVFEPGTMLLQVSTLNQSHASYTVNLDVAAAPQLEVEPNGGPNLASPFDTSSALYGSVEGSLDEDYYTFSVPADMAANEVFLLELDPLDAASAHYRCTLRDQNGDLVGQNNPNALRQGCVALATDLKASETYYFHIDAQRIHPTTPLNYKLSASIEAGVLEEEANDDISSATPIDIDALISGESLFGALPSASDTDYFSFTLDSDIAPGERIKLELAQIGPFGFQYGTWSVLDSAETTVASNNLNGPMLLQGLSAGTYYIELSRNSAMTAQGLVYQVKAF